MPEYHAYLLRLWQAGSPETPAWRATLEDPRTHQLTGFNDLEALCAFLQARQFAQSVEPGGSMDRKLSQDSQRRIS